MEVLPLSNIKKAKKKASRVRAVQSRYRGQTEKKRSYKQFRKFRSKPVFGKKGSKFEQKVEKAVARIVEERVATHDQWGTNKGILWDSNTGAQAVLKNTNGDIMVQNIIADPTQLLAVCNYLRGFFGNLQRFKVLEQVTRVDISNRVGGSPSEMDLYVWRCRKDLPITTDWTNYETFFNYGLTNTGAGITADLTDLGATPFQNPLWCQYFKCVRVIKKIMKPGENLRLRFSTKGSIQAWDYLRDGKFAQNLAYRNKTMVLMPVLRGPIVHDTTNPFTQIANFNAGFNVLYDFRYKTAFLEEAAKDSRFVQTLTYPTVGATCILDNTKNAGGIPIKG